MADTRLNKLTGSVMIDEKVAAFMIWEHLEGKDVIPILEIVLRDGRRVIITVVTDEARPVLTIVKIG